ncbi:MAG: F0F1 ATP synthase subunit gamma [Actinomycetales bacterium]|nr:F0F1 ATP synthase subunit gamma [Actinomycetales bacterium]
MGAQLRVFRRRIRSVQATKKITRAMELIASSRIVRAQQQEAASRPYAEGLRRAVSLAASHSRDDHPLLASLGRPRRSAVLIITADRGLAGAYSANVLREAEQLRELLADEGSQPVTYLIGRKAAGYYGFRRRDVAQSWTGFSDRPTYDDAREVARVLLEAYLRPASDGGVDEVQVVYTHFVTRASQEPRVLRIVPLEVVVEAVAASAEPITSASPHRATLPLYEFEPSAEGVLDSLLPRYIEYLLYNVLLQASASEHAARQRAMKAATDNAEELIKSLTRRANAARQAEITQEISEIVGGADALSAVTKAS